MRSFRKDRRGVSNVIVFVLGLVIVTVVVANVFLWNFEMNRLDWEKTQESFSIVNVTPYVETWSYNPSEFVLEGLTTNLSGGVSDLASSDDVYMTFRSYDSGADISDSADQTSDLYSPSAKGTHSNFTAQQYGPDLIYDTLTEGDSGTWSITYENSAESYSATGENSHNLNYSLQRGSGNDRLVVVTVSWEDAQASASIFSLTLDGIAMTHVVNVTVSSGYSEYISLWYLLDSNLPSSPGSYNVTVTVSESITREIYMAVAEYSGVEQSAPDDYDTNANTSPGNTSIVLTATANRSLVVAGVGEGGTNALTNTDNITNLQEQVLTSSGSALGHNINVNSGNITVGWNNLATREGMAGAVWKPNNTNYELDLEVQWTNVNYTLAHGGLCIKTGTFSGSEDLQVGVRSGGSWIWVMNLTVNQWNNVSVTSYLTGNTLTIKFLGGRETSDTTQDNWDIDLTLLHVWSDQNTAEVEFIGSSNTQDWTQLNWTIDSAWTTGSVDVTLQLYNYTLADYPSSGNGYMSYTSSATANTDETKNQTITVHPTHFRNATGHWKMKVRGVKVTDTQFDFKADWIEFKPTKAAGTLFNFKNTGSLTCHLVSLWIINSTVHMHYDIDVLVNSGDTSSYVREDIDLPDGQFTVKVVTERGNIEITS